MLPIAKMYSRVYTIWEQRLRQKCRKLTLINLIVILLLTFFMVIFLGIPLIFMNSAEWQRSIIFRPRNTPDEIQFTFNHFLEANHSARNLYVVVNRKENISLGVWHIDYGSNSIIEGSNPDFNTSLPAGNVPAILYFHRRYADRSYYLSTYRQLLQFFHVITFDYRSYGDSSKEKLTEEGIVEDSIELYKWLRSQTTADIYVWGDTLGAAIATHMVSRLLDENVIPMGLILENPFTTMADQLPYFWPMCRRFSWLPWYKMTILDSLEGNGLAFNTRQHILRVNCPILIITFNSNIVPYLFGMELWKIASENRDPLIQGNVTFNLVRWFYNFDNIPHVVRYFLKICNAYKKQRN